MNLVEIQSLTRKYADAHRARVEVVTALNDKLLALLRPKLALLTELAAREAHHEQNLREALRASPDLFVEPRTVVLHGIKVGLRKQPGAVQFDDPDRVVAAIRKLYAEDYAEDLIHTKETPNKEALKELKVIELARLGCQLTEDTDEPVISPEKNGVTKLVEALLKSLTPEKK